MKNELFLSLLLTFAGLVICQVALAQPPPPPVNPAAVPIDGGLSFLLAAGLGLGAKKAWEMRQK